MMLKAYKFRLYPTTEQKTMIAKHIGSCRFVFNWALELKIKSYQEEGKSFSRFDINKMIPELKKEHDRDINAAINIKKFALQEQNLIVI